MTEHEKYQEHIRHTHDAFCKTVIRHAAIDAARSIRSRRKREMIGQSSTEAERKRAARLENKALLPPRTKGGHSSCNEVCENRKSPGVAPPQRPRVSIHLTSIFRPD